MEEKYAKAVQKGDAYVSIRELYPGQVMITVGRIPGEELIPRFQELTVRQTTMDIVVQLYQDWRAQSGGNAAQAVEELPEKAE
jgi:hypothetical protein